MEIIILSKPDNNNYICITDIARYKNPFEPKDVVKNWMRSRTTIEFLGLWEKLNNPDFKGVEFDPLWIEAGSNSNMENINAVLINDNFSQSNRLIKLNQIAIQQIRVLQENTNRKLLN